jgi:putative DNA-invertase from lambdoid prophage Rac
MEYKNVCAIYARISTADKTQSTAMQIHDLEAYAAIHKYKIFRIYEDKGYSGSNSNRPMLKQLMQDMREGKVTHVLCWRLDRWFRSLKEVVNTLKEFEERSVTFISIKDGIDLSSSTGRLMANLLASFAQFELEVIRERVMSGLENARRNGRVGGRKQKIDVTEVYRLRELGHSMASIAKTMGISKSGVHQTLSKNRKFTSA